jgi:hypothetical protein
MIVKLNLVSNTGPTREKQVGSDRKVEQSSVVVWSNYCKVTVSSVRGGLRLIVLGRFLLPKGVRDDFEIFTLRYFNVL